MTRIEEAGRKKDEMNKEFAIQAKEALEAKMVAVEENREAIMLDMKEKLKVNEMIFIIFLFYAIFQL